MKEFGCNPGVISNKTEIYASNEVYAKNATSNVFKVLEDEHLTRPAASSIQISIISQDGANK